MEDYRKLTLEEYLQDVSNDEFIKEKIKEYKLLTNYDMIMVKLKLSEKD